MAVRKTLAYLLGVLFSISFLHDSKLLVQGFLPLKTIRPLRLEEARGTTQCKRTDATTLLRQSESEDGEKKSGGYKFGDISRFLAKRATDKVNELTGKETYEFGDLSRWLDGRAKERVQAIKGDQKGEYYKYEFGDLTRWADAVAKEKAAQYAGKEKAEEYQFGDISKTVISKVRSGEYNLEDVYLALRVLLTAGFSLLPIANLLPIKGLIQLVNLGLAKDVGGRMMGVLATTLDARMKEALTGKADYQLGDMTKERLVRSLAAFTGKDTYEFGDIARAIMDRGGKIQSSNGEEHELLIQDQVTEDLAKWDARYQGQEQVSDMERIAAAELEKWDKKFREQHEGGKLSNQNPE